MTSDWLKMALLSPQRQTAVGICSEFLSNTALRFERMKLGFLTLEAVAGLWASLMVDFNPSSDMTLAHVP